MKSASDSIACHATATAYHSQYWAHALTLRGSGGNIAALSRSIANARVDLNPHQVDPALFVLRSPFSNGAILADEVGRGKTIEAGIVLSQKWSERRRRILIVVPAMLRKQWQQELSEKFFIPSEILDTRVVDRLRKNNGSNHFTNRVPITQEFLPMDQEQVLNNDITEESGVDMERRIADIHQTCRTNADIQAAFDALQAELDARIQARLASTRQALMENFDEDARSRRKMSRDKSLDSLSQRERWLFDLTRQELYGQARFDRKLPVAEITFDYTILADQRRTEAAARLSGIDKRNALFSIRKSSSSIVGARTSSCRANRRSRNWTSRFGKFAAPPPLPSPFKTS